MDKRKLICGITMGEPAGIGPEVVLKALKEEGIQRLAKFLVIGNSYVLEKTARLTKIRLKIDKIKRADEFLRNDKRNIVLLDVGKISEFEFGQESLICAKTALACLETALRLIKSKKIDVLVTSPVNKHAINRVSSSFIGHTEYLAQATNRQNFAMMLVGGPLKVALVTRHLALKDVAKALTKERIYQTIYLTTDALKKYFRILRPRIGVCGLNPHSGEEGVFGQEEKRVIQPAVQKAKRFVSIEGPLPADTLFYWASLGRFDACVAMYHDQGLIPLKMLAFHQGVNLTLGLPFVRTSCDHGTAYNIAGKNRANPGSMMEAIKLAVKIGTRLKRI